jgi:hypothetical protein
MVSRENTRNLFGFLCSYSAIRARRAPAYISLLARKERGSGIGSSGCLPIDVNRKPSNPWLNDWAHRAVVTVFTVFTISEESRSSLFSLFWKNSSAHCFHYFLTDSPTKQSVKSESGELLDSSKTVKAVTTVLWSQSFCQLNPEHATKIPKSRLWNSEPCAISPKS